MSIKDEIRNHMAAKKIIGHDIMGLERFGEDTRHMIIFDVLEWECPVGDKGERIRMFLTDEGYKKALEAEDRKEMKIVRYTPVRKPRHHHYKRVRHVQPDHVEQAAIGETL